MKLKDIQRTVKQATDTFLGKVPKKGSVWVMKKNKKVEATVAVSNKNKRKIAFTTNVDNEMNIVSIEAFLSHFRKKS